MKIPGASLSGLHGPAAAGIAETNDRHKTVPQKISSLRICLASPQDIVASMVLVQKCGFNSFLDKNVATRPYRVNVEQTVCGRHRGNGRKVFLRCGDTWRIPGKNKAACGGFAALWITRNYSTSVLSTVLYTRQFPISSDASIRRKHAKLRHL
jgi:hypothetical protein